MAIQTYTGQLGAQEKRIESLTESISKGFSGLPRINDALRAALQRREKTLPALEVDIEGKIQELYTADKRMAGRYADPESEMFIEDPLARQRLASGQKADIRGEYGEILNLIKSRSEVLGSAIDKGTELYKAGIAAQELELKQAESAWDRIFKKMEFAEDKRKTGVKESEEAAETAASLEVQKLITTLQAGALADEKTERFYVGKQASKHPKYADEFWRVYNDWKESQEGGDINVDSAIRSILKGSSRLTTYSQDDRTRITERAEELGIKLPYTEAEFSMRGGQPEQQDIQDAQRQIDQYDDAMERAQVYLKIISDYPELEGWITP